MADTPTTQTAAADNKEALKTEAAELEQDIKEAEIDAAAARVAGDDARADRLEASITETKKELGEVKGLLKQLMDRPFAPAPGDGETPPAAPAGEDKKDQEQEEPPTEERPKGKKHWLFGDRWNQE